MSLYISYFFLIISMLFLFSGFVLLLRYSNNIGILLHVTNILNIYGINFFLLAICFSRFSYQFLLEVIIIIAVNTLCSLTLLHILFKKSDVGDTTEYAKKREKMLEARMQHFREVLRNKQPKNVVKNNVIENRGYDETDVYDSQDDTINYDQKVVKRQVDFSTFFSECVNRIAANSEGQPEEPSEEEVKEAIDDTEEKIREQKRALKKKIETARKNAYSTRKPEKIQETEKIIKDILDKYGLTEEMLNEA